MNCKTRREKIHETIEEMKRIAKITFITMVFVVIFALGLNWSWTIKENKELKNTIEYMEMERESTKKQTKEVNDQVIRYYLYLTEG